MTSVSLSFRPNVTHKSRKKVRRNFTFGENIPSGRKAKVGHMGPLDFRIAKFAARMLSVDFTEVILEFFQRV